MMRVLVVDDNGDILELLKNLLELSDFEVSTTKSGKESLTLISKEKFDVVLLDITMPEFSGFDVIQSLKESGEFDKTKIILFTASSISDAEVEKWKKLGIRDCLRKPFDPGVLFEAITNASIQT